MKTLAVLRPEPGNSATCARVAAAGGTALALPLFEVRPLVWTPPAAERFDALFLTSANAVRHAGAALMTYRDLPAFAVGEATAKAARAAGLSVPAVGDSDATALAALAGAHGVRNALHLAGRDVAHTALPNIAATVPVYASEPITPTAEQLDSLAGTAVLIHSPRAGARLAALVSDPANIRIAAISPAALAAAGGGWADSGVAAHPDDESLIAAALTLAD